MWLCDRFLGAVAFSALIREVAGTLPLHGYQSRVRPPGRGGEVPGCAPQILHLALSHHSIKLGKQTSKYLALWFAEE